MSPATSTRSTRWRRSGWTSGDYDRCGEAVRRGRAPASLFGLGPPRAADERLLLLYGAAISRRDQLGAALPDHPPRQQGRALRQLSDRDELLSADRGRQPRPEDHAAGGRFVRRADPPLSAEPLCRRRAAEARPDQRPSRRQGDGDRPLLPAPGQLAGRDASASAPSIDKYQTTTPHARGARAAGRILSRARHSRGGAQGRGGARRQLSGQRMVSSAATG